jgi:predicted porin
MKKTLIASAIAAVTFSGSALAMESASTLAARMDSMPQVYGNIQYVYTYSDSDVGGNPTIDQQKLDGGKGALQDNGTTIGVKHSQAITPGIEGFLKIELQGIAADTKGGENGLTDLDEAYIGVRGDSFGQVWIGSDDTQYESLLGDYGNWVFEYATLNPYASYTTGEGDMLQYASPSFGGLTLHAGVQVRGDGDSSNADYTNTSSEYPYQLAASYSMNDLTLSVVMDSNDGSFDRSDNSAGTSNENSYGLSVEYALGNLVLDAYFDTRKGVDGVPVVLTNDFNLDGDEGRDQFGVMASYNMGANTFRAAYEMASADTADLDVDVITLQALHNVSDNIYVYTELAQRKNDAKFADEEINQMNVGAVYYF